MDTCASRGLGISEGPHVPCHSSLNPPATFPVKVPASSTQKSHSPCPPTLRTCSQSQQLPPTELLPLLFRLFRVQDKSLRQLLFRHITSDIKNANKKGRNERLNRTLQNFMYTVLGDEHEGTAKKGLAVMTEMWRRRVWRDARTVNVIASATSHPSPRILLAALKFFIGQDAGAGAGAGADSDSDDEERGAGGPAAPTKEDVYGAFHKGTTSSKKKKQKKLRRVQAAVKKAGRRAEGTQSEAFAALQLLHDPQGFAEGLLRRLQSGGARFETRLVIMTVLSRAVGVHKLLVLNFYPFLQKYIAPHTLDVTTVLAAFIQARVVVLPVRDDCHVSGAGCRTASQQGAGCNRASHR